MQAMTMNYFRLFYSLRMSSLVHAPMDFYQRCADVDTVHRLTQICSRLADAVADADAN